jgi:hypothetical protein
MEIIVFKTDLPSPCPDPVVDALSNLRGLFRWNVDFEDCDRVLRIECQALPASAVLDRLRAVGVVCEELL